MTLESSYREIRGKAFARLAGGWVLLPAFFLAAGGSLYWWEAWAWCAVILVPMTIFVIWMTAKDPEFMARRMKMREREAVQKRLVYVGIPFYVAMLILPGIDRRFAWSEPATAVVVAALVLTLLGYLLILRVFIENRWAGRTIETGSGQKVISTGPYSIVRHPMYAGALLLWLASPLALGSWWALLPAFAFLPIIVLRIRNEEEVLLRELPGYDEYRKKVKQRLLPFIW